MASFRDLPLPVPYLPQMSDDGLITAPEIIDGGINIQVNRYQSFKPDDYVRVYFNYKEVQGKLLDTVDKLPFIATQDVSGLTPGIYPVHYIITDSSNNPSASPFVSAYFFPDGKYPYPAPVFLDATGDLLPVGTYQEFIRVSVAFPGMKSGDSILVYLSGYSQDGTFLDKIELQPYSVTGNDEINNLNGIPLYFKFPPDIALALNQKGTLQAYYYGVLAGVSGVSSAIATVRLFENGLLSLEPPVFPDAVNGIIRLTTAAQTSRLNARYSPLMQGDLVTFRTVGFTEGGDEVAGASWSLPVRTDATDVLNGSVTAIIPSEVLMSVKNNGLIQADYSVYSINQDQGVSPSSDVTIINQNGAIGISSMQLSTNAPFRDGSIKIQPCNRGVVYALPGSDVQVQIFQINGSGVQPQLREVDEFGGETGIMSDSIILRANRTGRAYFVAFVESAYGLCTLRATFEDAPALDVNTVFSRYTAGNAFMSYCCSTEAPADGIIRNSVYVLCTADVRSDVVSVSISGSSTAKLEGASVPGDTAQSGIYRLNEDKSVAIDITDTVPGNPDLKITLFLPSDNGSELTVSNMFFTLPFN